MALGYWLFGVARPRVALLYQFCRWKLLVLGRWLWMHGCVGGAVGCGWFAVVGAAN